MSSFAPATIETSPIFAVKDGTLCASTTLAPLAIERGAAGREPAPVAMSVPAETIVEPYEFVPFKVNVPAPVLVRVVVRPLVIEPNVIAVPAAVLNCEFVFIFTAPKVRLVPLVPVNDNCPTPIVRFPRVAVGEFSTSIVAGLSTCTAFE